MSHSHALSLPKPVLYGAAALVALTLALSAAARLGAPESAASPSVAVLAERTLRFEDRSDGGIDVIDARNNEIVEIVAPGSNGFLRGALRGLARQRKLAGLGPEIPFRLAVQSDGRLVLEDLATRRHIDLGSFGPTNSGVFARLLTAKGPSS
jgi:putative photosynthetic complex assembly protein